MGVCVVDSVFVVLHFPALARHHFIRICSIIMTVKNVYDVLVVGLGAVGSAAVYHAAKHGKV